MSDAAAEILRHLGGYRFQTSTHARNFSYPQNGLRFRIPSKQGDDDVMIIATQDTFSLTVRRAQKVIADLSGVTAAQLADTFWAAIKGVQI